MSDINRFHLDGTLFLETNHTGEVWIVDYGKCSEGVRTRLTLKALRELNSLLINRGLGNL